MLWPIFPIEAALFALAFVLVVANYRARNPGWLHDWVTWPWLLFGLGFSLYLTARAMNAGWHDFELAGWERVLTHALRIAGPSAVSLIFWLRWKRGR